MQGDSKRCYLIVLEWNVNLIEIMLLSEKVKLKNKHILDKNV